MAQEIKFTFKFDLPKGVKVFFNDVEKSVGGVNRKLKDTNRTVKQTGSAFTRLRTRIGGVVGAIGNVINKALSLRNALGLAAAAFAVRSIVRAATSVENALVGLNSVARATGQDAAAAKQAAVDLAQEGLVPLNQVAQSLKNLLSTGLDLPQAIKLFKTFRDSAAFGRQGTLALGQAIEGATQGFKNQLSILIDNAGITKNLSQLWKEYATEIGKTVGQLTQAEKIQGAYVGLLKEGAIFQGDFTRLLGTFSGAVDAAKTQFQFLLAELGELITKNPIIIKGVANLAKFFNVLTRAIRDNKDAIIGAINTLVNDFPRAVFVATEAITRLGSALLILNIGGFRTRFINAITTASSAAYSFFLLFRAQARLFLRQLLRMGRAVIVFSRRFIRSFRSMNFSIKGFIVALKSAGLAVKAFKIAISFGLLIAVDLLIEKIFDIADALSNVKNPLETLKLSFKATFLEIKLSAQETVNSINDFFSNINPFKSDTRKRLDEQTKKARDARIKATRQELNETKKAIAGQFKSIEPRKVIDQKNLDEIVSKTKEAVTLTKKEIDGIIGRLEETLANPFRGVFEFINGKLVLPEIDTEQGFFAGVRKAFNKLSTEASIQIAGIAGGFLTLATQGREGAKQFITGLGTTAASALGTAFGGPAGGRAAAAIAEPLIAALQEGPEAIKSQVRGFVNSIPLLVENLITAIPVLITEAIVGLSNAIVRIAERFDIIAVEFLKGLIKGLPRVISSLITLLPRVVVALIQSLPEFFKQLFRELPRAFRDLFSDPELIASIAVSFGTGFILAVPVFIRELIKNTPRLVSSFIKNMPSAAKAFGTALVKEAPRFIAELVRRLSFGVLGGSSSSSTGGSLLSPITSSLGGGSITSIAGGIVKTAASVFGSVGSAVSSFFGSFGFADGGQILATPSGFPNDSFPARLQSGEFVVKRGLTNQLENFLNNQGENQGQGIDERLVQRLESALSAPVTVEGRIVGMDNRAFARQILTINRQNRRTS